MMDKKSLTQQNAAIALRVSRRSIYLNALLTGFKLLAGVFAHSSAMISDAVHSASDVFSTIMVMVGVKLSSKQADDSHEYGHERLECIAAMLLAVLLSLTGVGIGIGGVQKILHPEQLAMPGLLALAAAMISILSKEGMYWCTRAAARKINSTALMADAWHHRSDALSSIGSLLGILGARLGYPVCDPIASLVICVFILKVGVDIFRSAVSELTDRSCPQETEQKMRTVVGSVPGVEHIDLLRTRQFAAFIYVDVEITADAQLPLVEAHAIAEKIHNTIESTFPTVKHCMVHVNPTTEEHHSN